MRLHIKRIMVATPRVQHLYSLGLYKQDQLNRAFGGGLPTGSLVVIEGRNGAGKSTLAGRFAYGLSEQSHTVTYLSTERGFSRFISQMNSLSYPVTKPILRRRLLYLFGELHSTDDDPPELLSRLTAAERLWNSDIVIIDTFSDILLYDPTVASLTAEGSQSRAIQRIISFFRKIISTGTSVVLLISPSVLPDGTVEPLRAVSDVLLDISVDNTTSQVRRSINVRRFAGMGQQVSDKIGFSIRPGTGIVIENRGVIQR